MNRIDRISAILIQLQSKSVVTGQAIADRFLISLRTAYRDIKTLPSALAAREKVLKSRKYPPIHFAYCSLLNAHNYS